MCEQSLDNLSGNNYIIDTIIRIDKLQKEITSDYNTCISCETSLVTSANNTIPVSITLCSGSFFEAIIEIPDVTTRFFRVESVREKRFVTLRLLEVVDVEGTSSLTATNQTVVLDTRCVTALQCYSPITISVCP